MQSANYPGTTVEIKEGISRAEDHDFLLCDLPGIYDLDAENPEEKITKDYLQSNVPDVVVFTLDAIRLTQGLFLLSQALEQKIPLIIAVTRLDIAEKKSLNIDFKALQDRLNSPVIPVSNTTRKGYEHLLHCISEKLVAKEKPEYIPICGSCKGCPYEQRHLASKSLRQEICKTELSPGKSALLDRFILHPVTGLLFFIISMFSLFWLIFFLAAYPMDWIDSSFAFLTNILDRFLSDSWFKSLLLDGIIAGLGGILVFLPQIMLLFFMLNLLENTGYLARIVCLIDKYLKKTGLSGTSFIPVLSAHACAIPAILSTRIIRNKTDRFLSIFILPFFSCSARIPIYVMLTALMFPDSPLKASLVFILCYFAGITIALLTAFLFRFKSKSAPSPLITELPAYSLPSVKTSFIAAIDQGKGFIKKAGTFILGFSIVIWFLSYFPNGNLETSLLAYLGKVISPLFAPLGFGWEITVGILTSFLAREVIVSTFAIIFGENNTSFDFSTSLTLLVFFIFALQCFPTLVASWKETASRKFVVGQFLYAFFVAYSFAFIARLLT